MADPFELPQAAPPPAERERADARRNRERILGAAARLIARNGLGCVSMDDVAAEAGVGKGTLYRRFGDRASLLRALLQDNEEAFQESCIRGAAPLGPGAPPEERLHAFGDALLDFLEIHAEFISAAEGMRPGIRFVTPVYAFQRTHVALLLRQVLGDEVRTEYLADVVMAPLAADFVLYQLRARELALDDLREGWHALVDAVLGTCAS